MNKRQQPIAVFDSGAGGISVLSELVRLMPNENYIYYGDSLNAPYGTRPTLQVRELTTIAIDKLVEMGAKEVVIACNTATSAAIRVLRAKYPHIPMIGLEPAIKPASAYAEGGRVLVMATELTLREEKLNALIARFGDRAEIVRLPCPELVELAENGKTEGAEIDAYLHKILAPHIGRIDAVVLGCTHFPLAKKAIQEAVGDVRLFDGGAGAARQARRELERVDLLTDSNSKGNITFTSSSPDKPTLYKAIFEKL
jgi:glutamate racemase